MAKVLQITDGTITVDLMAGDLYLRSGGWETESVDGATVWETIEAASRAADANIRTVLKNLDTLKDEALRYKTDQKENTPVWFYFQAEGESVKRSVVLDIRYSYRAEENITPVQGGRGGLLTLAIERYGVYESSAASSFASGSINLNGGQWQAGNAAGVEPQRMVSLIIDPTSTAELTKLWVGVRKPRYGMTGFVSLWEAENGDTTGGVDTAVSADATASSSSKMRITFSTTATLAYRFGLKWGAVGTANYDDIAGNYLILARVKLGSATDEVHLQVREGVGISESVGEYSVIGDLYLSAIENANLTNWNLVEIGYAQIPPMGNREGVAMSGDEIKNYVLRFYAERISAAATLDIDELILIPTDGLAVIDNAHLGGSSDFTIKIYTSVLDEIDAYSVYASTDGGMVHLSGEFTDWFYPRDGGVLVVAAQELTKHTLTPTTTLSMSVYPRWSMYR